MATRKTKEPAAQLLPGFKPMSCLWEGPHAPYPSEHSAKWSLRELRPQLARAQALAKPGRVMMIHMDRYLRVAEMAAIRKACGVASFDEQIIGQPPASSARAD